MSGGVDWGTVGTVFVSSLAAGFGFGVPVYLLARVLVAEVLSSPVVQAVGRAAMKFSGGKGDWKGAIVTGGFKLLGKVADKWFGGEE